MLLLLDNSEVDVSFVKTATIPLVGDAAGVGASFVDCVGFTLFGDATGGFV